VEHEALRLARRSASWRNYNDEAEDPLSGVANLFDVSLAFIVALLITLFMLFSAVDFLDPESNVTIVRENDDGTVEIVVKEGDKIEIQRVTADTMSGQGVRLGTAYRLANGEVVYVPEEDSPTQVSQ
jgi:hypothetical protein